MSKTITVKELGYHRFQLHINDSPVGPERNSVSEFDEVRTWLGDLSGVEVLPYLSEFLAYNDAEIANEEEDGTNLNIQRMQEEVSEWAERNFGDTPCHRPLLGMVEELGEICATFSNIAQASDFSHLTIRCMAYLGKMAHSQLKNEQGIRGTSEEHAHAYMENMRPLVHTLGYLSGMRKDFPQTAFEKTDTIADGLGDLFVYACHFSHCTGIELHDAIFDTWAKAKMRDWQKNKTNGEVIEVVATLMGNPKTEHIEGTDTYKHTFTSPE